VIEEERVTPDELQERARRFSMRVIKLVDALPNRVSARVIAHQLVRAGTSVAANYRAARRARSRREFIAKIGVVSEEADETLHGLETVRDAGYFAPGRLGSLLQESDELVRLFARSRGTVRTSGAREKRPNALLQSPNHEITKSQNRQGAF
jgi:four helix bundle protein